ncbi:MAG: TraR/DksA C4-type zinc finger protein [Bacteroidetes bacterium]|nr:TraR/DksA C4-type zinc finger protein [Bacteroidota bacterium]
MRENLKQIPTGVINDKVSKIKSTRNSISGENNLKEEATGNAKIKSRYSDAELREFKELIASKLEDARKEAQSLQDIMRKTHDNGTDDTARTFKNLEECSDTLAKEEIGQLVSRQQKFIEQLENALARIETKTYGICHNTGNLIPKERLRIVPHTTQSIEAKRRQER